MSDTYEMRTSSYCSFVFVRAAHHMPESWRIAQRELAHLEAYSAGWIDCELREWEDRANAEDCWRDWWKTGRGWIEPELDDE